MKRLYIILIAYLCTTSFVLPQGYLRFSPVGIYLQMGNEIPGHSAVSAYIIERQDGYGRIKTDSVSFPASKEAFIRLTEDYSALLRQKVPEQKVLDFVYSASQNYGIRDSLKSYGNIFTLNIALGTAFLDISAESSGNYEYKVFAIKNGIREQIYSSGKIEFIQKSADCSFELDKIEGTEKKIEMIINSSGNEVVSYIVLRKEIREKEYREVKLNGVFYYSEGKKLLKLEDKDVVSGEVYQYRIFPLDALGNPGVPAENITAAAYDFAKIVNLTGIKAEASPDGKGIKISWDSLTSRYATSFCIYRSENYDSLFSQIAELPLVITEFTDLLTEPMKKYYYRIGLTGMLGEKSVMSSRVFAFWEDKEAPLPVTDLQAFPHKKGVELRWSEYSANIKGYYVFRSTGFEGELKMISGLIPAEDSLVVYIDSTSNLSGKRGYLYSIVKENTSHTKSAFSDTVFARTGIIPKVREPYNITASASDGYVNLYWQDMSGFDETIVLYRIYRKVSEDNEFSEIENAIQSSDKNHYTDVNVVSGKEYVYSVKSIDLFGNESGFGKGTRVRVPEKHPSPGSRLKGYYIDNSVILTWDEAFQPDLASYQLFRYQRGFEQELIAEIPKGQELIYKDKGINRGDLYFYYIKLKTSDGKTGLKGKEVSILAD